MKKTRSKILSRSISFILIVILILQSVALVSAANIDLSVNDPHVPAGSKLLSLGKEVTASSDYAPHDAKWSKAFLTDGIVGTVVNEPYAWTTNPNSDNNQADPAWAVVDLGGEFELSRIALYPRQDGGTAGSSFPIDYYYEFSKDGVNYTNKISITDKTNVGASPVITDIDEEVTARYVKIYITKRSAALVQLSEMAIYGVAKASMGIVKNRLLLKTNETRKVSYVLSHIEESEVDLEWSSSKPLSVEVDQLGNIKTKAEGTAIITVKDKLSSLKAECEVIVEKEPFDAKSEIMISAFWAPQPEEYINSTQYDYLKEANFNYVQNVKTSEIVGRSHNLEMARLAYERNMQIGVADSRFGNYLNMTNDEIEAMTKEYSDIPGVGGMYVCDEPYNANPYARVLQSIKRASPNAFAYLNFLPSGSYGNETRYRAQMQDFVKLTGAKNLDYLMYDRYPFGWTANSLDYTGMLRNMESVWKVGLENDVKTGLYIQSIGVVNGFRRTNENEIRYEVFTALAYGYKQLSYFTWFSPTDRGEAFTDAIISPTGEKTDLFEPVKKLNGEVMNLSDTLFNLDAQKVYFAGDNTYNMTKVPSDFFVQPGDNKNMMYSYMRDKTSGRNYLMVVNTSFTDSVSTTLNFNSAITSLQEVVKSTGNVVPVTLSKNSVSLDFTPGEGRLFVLPVNYDFGVDTPKNQNDVNLALGADVDATSSLGSGDNYMRFLTDGKDFSVPESQGWKSENFDGADNEVNVTLDLGAVLSFNRVDLFPAGELGNYAIVFPRDFKIEVSADGSNWSTVVNKTDYPTPYFDVPVFEFNKVNARYIKINITKLPYFIGSYEVALSEIKVFNDTGSSPEPSAPPTVTTPIEYNFGDNIALNKAIATSSSGGAEFEGWATRFLNDGQKGPTSTTNGWTSAVGKNPTENATEWMAIFFGGKYMVDEIIVYPRSDPGAAGGGFPTDYTIELSVDGIDWIEVVKKIGETGLNANARVFNLEAPVEAAFVRFTGTRLKFGGNTRDGYLMQVNEFEAYGVPVCDKIPLKASIASLNSLIQSTYTQTSWSGIEPAKTYAKGIDNKEYATQAEANKAIYDIDSAIKALKERANNTDIQAAIDATSSLVEADYTKTSWSALNNAINSAKIVMDDVDATLANGVDAVNAINTAKSALIARANNADIQKAIDSAFTDLVETDYTKTSWKALTTAVENAKAIIANVDATLADGVGAVDAITTAKAALVDAANLTELEKAIDDASVYDEKDYTSTTWKALQDAIDAAKAIAENPDATVEDAEAAIAAIADAITALKKAADKVELATLIEEKDSLRADEYTASTWLDYVTAHNDAKTVFENGDATQTEVDEAIKALKDAKSALEKVVVKPKPDPKPTKPSPSTGEKGLSKIIVLITALLLALAIILKKKKISVT